MTQLIQKEDILSDVLANHHELIPVVNRFGIRLGVGEKSIKRVCDEKKINLDVLLSVLNSYLFETYQPDIDAFGIEWVVNYFGASIENYLQAMVPNIEKHIHAFVAISGAGNSELKLLERLFTQFKQTLKHHFEKGIDYMDDYPHEILHDLKNILIKHVPEKYNQNLCHAVIFSIGSLEKDLIAQNRLRKILLLPKIKELNATDIQNLQATIAEEHPIVDENKKSLLTVREKEILKLIAQGFINKEIADKLNISLNTVLTHRKNIITKTGIRTVSGLTFFCISHGLLSSEELKPIGFNKNDTSPLSQI